MIDVYLLLGSNLGNRRNYLQKAAALIAREVAPIVKASGIYETQAWGKTNLPDYLNQVIKVKTGMPAQGILDKILSIEVQLGRQREEKWGSRTIDIDILFYGDQIINQPELIVPHPELHKRRFTLEPLNEIEPHVVHPLLNKAIFELKNELIDELIVKKLYF